MKSRSWTSGRRKTLDEMVRKVRKIQIKPWVEGPIELLKHGFEHLKMDTDFDYRISMISIDNSVELMLKTYLGLPKRITNINGISRSKYNDISNSFPALLDALEEYAPEKIVGVELGDLEWFHRLRNQLYHDGNGITVEKQKVEVYAEIAAILCSNLFEIDLDEFFSELPHSLAGEFFNVWSKFVVKIQNLYEYHTNKEANKPTSLLMSILYKYEFVDEETFVDFKSLFNIRNSLAHGGEMKFSEVQKAILKLKDLIVELDNNII